MLFSIVKLFKFITKIRKAIIVSSVAVNFHLNVEILWFDAMALASFRLNCSECLINLDLLLQIKNYYQKYQHYSSLSLNCFPYGATNQASKKCCSNFGELSIFGTLNKDSVGACFFYPSFSKPLPTQLRHPD